MNDATAQVAKMPDELRELADAACNGTLSVSQRDRLEEIVRHDKDARLAYLAYLDIHAQLSWEGRSGTVDECAVGAERASVPVAGASAPTPASTPSAKSARRRRQLWWAGAAAVAAAVVVVAVIGLRPLWRPTPEAQPQCVATWGRGLDTLWKKSPATGVARQPEPGDEILPGLYELERGVARLDFVGGAEVTLEAPTTIELIDGRTGRLARGSLVVRMRADQPAGFTIRTRRADIVDRGTEFGVAVDDDGHTFVQVFEGHVDAQIASGEIDTEVVSRRIWPFSALHLAADSLTSPKKVPFEPLRFTRRCPKTAAPKLETATEPLVSLEHDPNATSHVKALAASFETAPASALQLGTIFKPFTELNDLTQGELTALIPALLQMLGDERPLAVNTGLVDSPVRLRVADRADLVLQFIAGISPEGKDRKAAWEQWWTVAQEKPRSAWFAERQAGFRQALDEWRKGTSYEGGLHALNAVEIAGRAGDQTVLAALMDTVAGELPRAHQTEVSLAAVLNCIGQLGSAVLVPELIQLVRPLNRDQLTAVPSGYSEPHVRRSDALRAFAAALDRLSGTELAGDSLTVIGPPSYEMCALEEDAFDQWLQAAARRAGEPVYESPSDRTDGDEDMPGPEG